MCGHSCFERPFKPTVTEHEQTLDDDVCGYNTHLKKVREERMVSEILFVLLPFTISFPLSILSLTFISLCKLWLGSLGNGFFFFSCPTLIR